MEPTQTQTNESNKAAGQTLIEQLPEEMQSFCASGKSVMDLAHLVKNIIQIVSGSAEIVDLGLQRKQYDRVQRSWDIFEPNFIRLKKFILDLIKYTKHYPIQRTDCDFNQTLIKGIQACEYFLKNKSAKIRLHQDKNIPPAKLDAERIEEMVMNLITHAFDNLKDSTGIINIQSRYLPLHRQIQLVVSDDGPGLTDELIRRIAEPFERNRAMTGTGFDIPLTHLYIEQHNGYMEITADQPQGNHVTVYLPIE